MTETHVVMRVMCYATMPSGRSLREVLKGWVLGARQEVWNQNSKAQLEVLGYQRVDLPICRKAVEAPVEAPV